MPWLRPTLAARAMGMSPNAMEMRIRRAKAGAKVRGDLQWRVDNGATEVWVADDLVPEVSAAEVLSLVDALATRAANLSTEVESMRTKIRLYVQRVRK
jgi:hypothetical protein